MIIELALVLANTTFSERIKVSTIVDLSGARVALYLSLPLGFPPWEEMG